MEEATPQPSPAPKTARPYCLRAITARMRRAGSLFVRAKRDRAIQAAFCCWFTGSAALGSTIGFGAAPNEYIAGWMMTLSEAWGALYGKKWDSDKAYAIGTGIYLLGLGTQRWPEIVANPRIAAIHAALLLLNIPVLTYLRTRNRAREKLEAFYKNGQHMTRDLRTKIYEKALLSFANPAALALRGNMAYHIFCLSEVALGWHVHKDPSKLPLLLVYPAWITGNLLARLSEKPHNRQTYMARFARKALKEKYATVSPQ